MKAEVSVGPLSVLIDPRRLKNILEESTSGIHPAAEYIIKKQLEESDIILITKTDLYNPEEINFLSRMLKERFPECEIRPISAKTGEGIEGWMDTVLNGRDAGKHILDIDYDRYAEGEAVLGWLNCSVSLTGNEVDWDAFTRLFMQELAAELDRRNIPVGHIKTLVEKGDRYI
jgi:G3E family GTPase